MNPLQGFDNPGDESIIYNNRTSTRFIIAKIFHIKEKTYHVNHPRVIHINDHLNFRLWG